MKMLRVEMFIPLYPAAPRTTLLRGIVDEAGGVTVTEGTGHWVDGEDDLIVERVQTVLFFVEDNDDNRLWVEELAIEYKEDAAQDAVLYVLNGTDFHMIEEN